MSNKTSFKTIDEFLYQPNKTFVIPNYQRGYKWSVQKNDKASAVTKLCDNLIKAQVKSQYFLQGVTVVEENNKIILIDGQQRTTTLYLLLWWIDEKLVKDIDIEYDIRKQSDEFIQKLSKEDSYLQISGKENQDIYYFKKAIHQIQSELSKLSQSEKEALIDFIKEKVKILYIIIDKDKATKTFTMMNGSKATMLTEELIKAEMLRTVSLPEIEKKKVSTSIDENLKDLKEIISIDWETNALRSRYAREWDKWLYWWNRKDVKEFFKVEKPMGLLLKFYLKEDKEFSFDSFKKMMSPKHNIKEETQKTEKQRTKKLFKELRDLQKSFEDIFTKARVHNYLGLALIDAGKEKLDIIQYFMGNKNDTAKLKEYSLYKSIGATHKEIIGNSKTLSEKAEETRNILLEDFIYFSDNANVANKQLIRLNIEEDNLLERKFDFSIWEEKSLEHIFPKSQVFHEDDEGRLLNGNNDIIDKDKNSLINDINWLNRDDFNKNGSEHCIGNLVLLYGKNNSSFGAKPVPEKKKAYFNTSAKKQFESRHLLHTISVFAQDSWGIIEIQANKAKFIDRFNSDYKSILQNQDIND